MPIYREITASLVTKRVPEKFLRRVIDGNNDKYHSLILVSPWIESMADEPYGLGRLMKQIQKHAIRTYVFTRPPQEGWHEEAVRMMCQAATVEMNYNALLHAKFFVCDCEPYGFAMLATANLTANAILGYEVGMMVEGRGGGEPIVSKLRDLALITLRSYRETKRVKEILLQKRGDRNGRNERMVLSK